MDITGLIVNLVSGGVGGNLSAAAMKDKSLGAIGNTVAGAIGGVAGAYITQAVGILQNLGLADMTVGSVATEAGAAAIGGAILTAVIGFIKSKMSK